LSRVFPEISGTSTDLWIAASNGTVAHLARTTWDHPDTFAGVDLNAAVGTDVIAVGTSQKLSNLSLDRKC
jgi:hypothetical protein